MRRRPKPAKMKSQGSQPRAGKPPQTDDARVRDLEEHLAEARQREAEAQEQQMATAEILRVISQSRTDVQAVLDVVLQSAVRLCDGFFAGFFAVKQQHLHLVATHAVPEKALEILRESFPVPLDMDIILTRAARERRVVQVRDIQEEGSPTRRHLSSATGERAHIAVPMVREGSALGVIAVSRREARDFTDKQVALLQTFADQAVIAIENVRLFKELQASNRELTTALDQQTATSDILRAISASPVDVQPVFEAIARNSVRLCNGVMGAVFRFDGEFMHIGALHGFSADGEEATRRIFPTRPERRIIAARAVLSRAIVHVPDVMADPEFDYAALATTAGWRSLLVVPMLRGGEVLGTVGVARAQIGLFPDQEVALLQTFADQAVIAIENVRLFTELQTSNRELTTALDTQTATSEILRVISSSPTDVQPVFDAIVRSAVRLLGGHSGGLTRIVGDQRVLAAVASSDPDAVSALRATYPRPADGPGAHGQAIRDRAPVNIVDMHTDLRVTDAGREAARLASYRSVVAVPLLRHSEAIGALAVTRREPGGFTEDEIALLRTFADQGVIAIENARLFTELQTSNRELTTALDTQTATSDILRVISRSQTDVQPVFDTILASAVRLLGAYSGSLTRVAGDQIELVALTSTDDAGDAAVRARYPQRLRSEDPQAQALRDRVPLNFADAQSDARLPEATRAYACARGWRSAVLVPMLRHGEGVGTISVTRREPGGFTVDEIGLLQSFADQAVIAIENVRLFKELEASNQEIAEKSRQLEVASHHKSEFLANMSHELRTPLNAVIGFSDVLLQRMFGDLNARQEEYLKDISASGQHLLSLINDILDLSKIEAGRMELTPAPFHLPTALDNAVTLVRERAARHGIALELDLDPQLGEIVGDERKVKQVLLNLLSNAVKFTPEGGRISLKARRTDGAVEIAVADTGVGIAPEDQAAIFEEFRQVGHDESRKQEGTGLGLTLAKKFVELHGGRIWVESAPSRGSTFTFTLPLR